MRPAGGEPMFLTLSMCYDPSAVWRSLQPPPQNNVLTTKNKMQMIKELILMIKELTLNHGYQNVKRLCDTDVSINVANNEI